VDDLVEEVVGIAGRDLALLRPRDAEALLSEEAFEHEEFLPYWAELWPSALALARAVAARRLKGARTLELGCGLGLPSLAAVLAGGRVTATDWAPDAIAMTKENAKRNRIELTAFTVSWTEPDQLIEQAPWDFVIASDVLYEPRNGDALLPLLPQLVAKGEIWLADPGRPAAGPVLERARERFEIDSRAAPEIPHGAVHRMRLKGSEA
jgi:predicted nicotinamide N-methyase